MKQKIILVSCLFLLTLMALPARSTVLLEGTDLKNRDVETLDLNEVGKEKLKLGVSLGYPMTGFTAGWQAGKSLELDLLLGSWNYDSFCIGGSAMISLVDLKIGGELFPLTAGPFVYTGISNDGADLSMGAMVRMEYTFDFRLNLYLESGLAINVTDLDDNPLGLPLSLGIRYIF